MTSYSHFLKHILLEYVEITGRMQALQQAARTLVRNLIVQLLYKTKYSISTTYSRILCVSSRIVIYYQVSLFEKEEGIAYLYYPLGLFQLHHYDVFKCCLGHHGLIQQMWQELQETRALLK